MGINLRVTRPIEIHDNDIDYYFNSLVKFLGEYEIQKKISRIKRTYDYEKGQIYKKFYLDRKYSWWNSFIKIYEYKKKGGSFKGHLKDEFIDVITTAHYIRYLYSTFTKKKKELLKKEILFSEEVHPAIFELEIAANLWKYGFEIEWFDPIQENRIPEFCATLDELKIEIECKSRNINTGRQILLEDFYRFSDELISKLEKLMFSGVVELNFNSKLSSSSIFRKKIISEIVTYCMSTKNDLENIFNESDYQVKITKFSNNTTINDYDNFITETQKELIPLPYFTYSKWKNEKDCEKEILFIMRNYKEDKVLAKIIDEVKDGIKQFTKKNKSIICFYLPEFSSFKGLEKDTSFSLSTNKVLQKEGLNFLWGIVYFSDYKIDKTSKAKYKSSFPTLGFENPDFPIEENGIRFLDFLAKWNSD
jgi:hypothetical protein